MAMQALDVSWEPAQAPCGVIRTLGDPGHTLRVFEEVLIAPVPPRQDCWLIDNRAVEEAIPLAQLAQFVQRLKHCRRALDEISVAWVAPAPWSISRQALVNQLPFHFRRFVGVEEARRWLLFQS